MNVQIIALPEHNGFNVAVVEDVNKDTAESLISLYKTALPALLAAVKDFQADTLGEPIATIPHIDAGQMVMGILPIKKALDLEMSIYNNYTYKEGDFESRLSIGHNAEVVFFGDNAASDEVIDAFKEHAKGAAESSVGIADGLIVPRELIGELITELEANL